MSTTSLLGREQAIDEVAGLVERPGVRLVTLTGPGGVGKTRLAVAVGERLRGRFGAGTVFVPLEAVTDPGRVLAAIGRAAGADLAGTGSPVEALAETFGDGAWLLILDNLEQVVQAAPDLGELLARCPQLAILATSRTVLGLGAEREYPVPPLPLPADPGTAAAEIAASPAVALFVDRARAVRPGFALTEGNAAAVAEICRRLEGLPLAIELAAARTRLLDPPALLDRLAASLDALGTGAVDLPERQRTLRATVEWSVGLLTTPSGHCWRSRRSSSAAGPSRPRPRWRAWRRTGRWSCRRRWPGTAWSMSTVLSSGPGRGCWRPSASSWPSGWRPGPTPTRSGGATPASTGRWPNRPTGRCAPRPERVAGAAGGRGGQPGRRGALVPGPRPRAAAPPVPGPVAVLDRAGPRARGLVLGGAAAARRRHAGPAGPAPSWRGRRWCSPSTSGTTRRR